MSLISIAQNVAVNVGLEKPTTAEGSDATVQKLVRFINDAGDELARRVDWSNLTKTLAITGDGTNSAFDLASDHARLSPGLSVTVDGNPLRGGISADEWFSLTPTEGTPRYFRILGRTISFYPYPADGKTGSVSYQSDRWAQNSDGQAIGGMMSNDDVALIPEDLIAKGAIWRWRRHDGRDFGDYLAEFEAALVDYAKAEGGVRQP